MEARSKVEIHPAEAVAGRPLAKLPRSSDRYNRWMRAWAAQQRRSAWRRQRRV